MDKISKFSTKFNGTMYLVRNDGKVSSFAFGFRSVEYARSECQWWLMLRPDVCFVSVVVGSVLVAKAGEFPWSVDGVSLAPLAC